MSHDYIVIGAGVHGSAASYYLAKSGASVLLLEAKTVASGASGGVGKRGVRANARDIRELPLMKIAYDMWPGINEELGLKVGYERTGGIELVGPDVFADKSLHDQLKTRVGVQSAFGIETRIIDKAELDTLEPGASAETVAGALYCPADGTGDHTEVTRGYAVAAQAAGAELKENTPVTGITGKNADGLYTVTTEDGTAHTATRGVLVTANSYSRRLLADSFGIDVPITRFNPQMTPVRAAGGFTFKHLLGHHSLPFAAKTITIDGEDVVMLSGGRTGDWDYESETGTPRPETAEKSIIDATSIYPAFAGAEVVVTDASRPESLTVDDIPVIDEVPGNPGVFFATGWSGHGFAISPAVATLLAGWITSGERPAELEPFTFARFPQVSQA
ncbi:FAD-binding oxidoreductase [Brevibacterium sp. 50QC2O2]|uniref:NAD(P)/FAD-dependent oxidoreductase n=1 Tax=Brevibacterium sp. 50QC2O2 TaxID=2968459 RepID=UPI00211CEEF4|nr:FAD-binding oxidoreductase [Brevibacterium sp. 50QC2O2]MCQ9389733.1 FAD-binding oxidoreductase [Brevibacterium sp. 50QC2O2]